MFRNLDKPSPELEEELQATLDTNLALATETVRNAEVLVLITGAGFSADSGLAVYADVANIKAYQQRNLDYHDICQPRWLGSDPELFYGFWGQCFNDYRMTQPHKGYEIIAKWRDKKNNGPAADEMRKYTECQEQSSLLTGEGGVSDPYVVQGRAGAFFTFTSNVDAHSFDFFEAHEIRECHGNVELWQCHSNRCSDGYGSRPIWRAPTKHRFVVDAETMLAPRCPSSTTTTTTMDSFHPIVPVESLRDDAGEEETETAHVGRVLGSARRCPLKYMLVDNEAIDSAEFAPENWPRCRSCDGAARPAILMFGDLHWHDNDAQEGRWLDWQQALYKLAKDRCDQGNPLKVAILEIGCGLNVATCRYQSEALVMQLEEKEADVKLIRVNPDFPLVDNDENIDGANVISVMAIGLDSLEKMDEMLDSMED